MPAPAGQPPLPKEMPPTGAAIMLVLMGFTIGAYSGDTSAMRNHVVAAQTMTPEQIAQARKMARDCMNRKFAGCD
jgi:hypothetical protein